MALRHVGLCKGGPYDGQHRVYFSDEMDVLVPDPPLYERPKRLGTYRLKDEMWIFEYA